MREAMALPQVGEMLGPLSIAVTAEQVHAYARASGDMNPIHIDAAFAATTEFGAPIVHGMLLLACMARLLGARFGRAWADSGTLDARFRAPAMVGGTIVVQGLVERVGTAEGKARVECTLSIADPAGRVLVTATASISRVWA